MESPRTADAPDEQGPGAIKGQASTQPSGADDAPEDEGVSYQRLLEILEQGDTGGLSDAELAAIVRSLGQSNVRLALKAQAFAGPLPPPEVIAAFAKHYPEAPEYIFDYARKEQQHRHQIESELNKAIIEDRRQDRRAEAKGQWFALVIVLAALSATIALAALGAIWPAAVVGGATIVSLAIVFLNNQAGRHLARRLHWPSQGRRQAAEREGDASE